MNRRRPRAAWALALLGAAGPAAAEDFLRPALHGEMRQEGAVFTHDASLQKLRTMVTGELDLGLGGRAQFKGSLRAWYDLRSELDNDYRRATAGEGRRRLDLREATLRLSHGRTDWTLGKQLVSWGKADGVRVLDLVNPVDLREFVLEDFADSKIPLWMVNLRHYVGGAGVQVLVLPEHEPHRLAPAGSDYYDAFHDPQRAAGLPTAGPRDWRVRDLEAGVQVSGRLGRADVSLNYFYGYDPTPVVDLRPSRGPSGPVFDPLRAYDRNHAFGGSFATPLGSWVARGEAVRFEGRRFAVRSDALPLALAVDPQGGGLAERGQTQVLLGLDHSWNWAFLSVQLVLDRVGGGALPLERRRTEPLGTLLFWRDWRNATLRAQLLAITHLRERTWVLQPRLIYQLTDRFSTTVGADLVETDDPHAFFGQFQRANRGLLSLRYQF